MFATAGAEYDPVYITFGICCWRDVNAFGAQREQILPSLRLGSGKLEPCFNSRRLARRHEARKSSQTLHHRAWDLTRSGSSDSKSYQPIACTGYQTKYPDARLESGGRFRLMRRCRWPAGKPPSRIKIPTEPCRRGPQVVWRNNLNRNIQFQNSHPCK